MVALIQNYGLHTAVHEAVYEGAGVWVQEAGDADVSAPQVALGPTGAAAQLAVGVGVVAQHGLGARASSDTPSRFRSSSSHLQGRLAQELAGLAGGRDQLVGVDVDGG